MRESTAWAIGTVAGLSALGASAGAGIVLTDHFTPAAFASIVFVDLFLACGLAMQLHRRGSRLAPLVGGLAGFGSMVGFFAAPLAARPGAPLPDTVLVLLVPALVAGMLAAAGTQFLSAGVDRYRARHGLVHAPPRDEA